MAKHIIPALALTALFADSALALKNFDYLEGVAYGQDVGVRYTCKVEKKESSEHSYTQAQIDKAQFSVIVKSTTNPLA